MKGKRKDRDDEPDVQRSLLGLENVEDVGGVAGKLIERDFDFLGRVLDGNVHAGHHRRRQHYSDGATFFINFLVAPPSPSLREKRKNTSTSETKTS